MPARLVLLLFCLLLAGCPARPEPLPPLEPAEPVGPVRVLVVNDPLLATALERQWSAQIGKPLEVEQATVEELLSGSAAAADLLIYPPGLLGELVQRERLAPLPEAMLDSAALGRRDLLPLTRQYEMRWGDQNYGIPLAAPRWALLYRTDLLEQLGAAPPDTWPAYAALAARLNDGSQLGELAPAEGTAWSGTVEPWHESTRGELLLARAASSIQRQGQLSTLFEFASMKALIDSPPFVAALENMQQVAKAMPEDALTITPGEARRRLLGGQAGMAITWLPAPPDPQLEPAFASETPPLGVAPLPGSSTVYLHESKQTVARESDLLRVPLVGFSGRMGSVIAGTPRQRAALDLLTLLAGEEWSVEVMRRSQVAHPFRRQHLEQLGPWLGPDIPLDTGRQYADYLVQLELSPLVLVSPRIPGRTAYLAALSQAVQQVVEGEQSPQEAIAAAAVAWNAITEELGVTQQRSAYRQSAGVGF